MAPSIFRKPNRAEAPEEPKDLPYRPREPFLSASEVAFFKFLRETMRDRFLICPKVALMDILTVARPNENVHFFRQIFRKNVDFLLLHPSTFRPALAIKLVRPLTGPDDEISQSGQFLQEVCAAAGIPLVCVPSSDRYELNELMPLFELAVERVKTTPRPGGANDFSPICPNCGITMVLRTVRSGPQAGTHYYGCMNYPQCKETAPLPK